MNKQTLIVGIDQSLSNTGVCIMSPFQKIERYTSIQSNPKDTLFTRMNFISSEILNTIYREFYPDIEYDVHVCLEKPKSSMMSSIKNGKTFNFLSRSTSSLIKLSAIIALKMYNIYDIYRDVTIYEVPSTTHKKYTTGNGRCDKKEMLKVINYKYSLDIKNDNIADAISIANCLEGNLLNNNLDKFEIIFKG